ncbi:MAG: sugar ABC transporter permease [Nitrososphaeria archaeon]
MVKLTAYHLFILFAVAYVVIISIFPMALMVYGSFTNWRLGISEMNWIGIKYYMDFFEDYRFYNSLKVTFFLTGLAVLIEVALGLLLAHLMRLNIRFRKVFRTVFLIPLFCAPVAVALMGEIIFYESGGPVNSILNILGFGNFPWRSSPIIAPFTVVLCDVWMWTPFCFLITLAALEGVPKELHEASMVDGASSFQIFKSIDLPLIISPLITILMFRILDTIKIFDIPFTLVGGGGPGIATETMSIYIYKIAFRDFTLGKASAISLIFLVIIAIITSLFIKRLRKYYV